MLRRVRDVALWFSRGRLDGGYLSSFRIGRGFSRLFNARLGGNLRLFGFGVPSRRVLGRGGQDWVYDDLELVSLLFARIEVLDELLGPSLVPTVRLLNRLYAQSRSRLEFDCWLFGLLLFRLGVVLVVDVLHVQKSHGSSCRVVTYALVVGENRAGQLNEVRFIR